MNNISSFGLDTMMNLASKGTEMGMQSAFDTAQAKRNAQIQEKLMQANNKLLRENFRDSAMLAKAGKIAAGLNPVSDFETSNISPSIPSVNSPVASPSSTSFTQMRQLQNETKVADAQENLLNEQAEGQNILNNRNRGYDSSLQSLVQKFPELDLSNVELSNKGVFDALTDFENLRRNTLSNKRSNEEDKLYYDALNAIRNDPAKKVEFEESVLENVRTIKLANQKLFGEIDLQKASKREIYAHIKNLDADTIYKEILTNLSWEQSRYYAQLTENLEYDSDWKLLDIGLDEENEDSARALAVLAIKHGNIDGILPKLLDIPKQLINGVVEMFKFKKFKEAMERVRTLDKDKFDFEKLKFETNKNKTTHTHTEKFDSEGNVVGGSYTTTRSN